MNENGLKLPVLKKYLLVTAKCNLVPSKRMV